VWDGVPCRLIEASSTLHRLRYRSSNRAARHAAHARCLPVPPWPDTLGGDNWATAGRGLSPYRSRASPRRKLPAFTIPTRRLYCTSATNNPLKKLMIVNVPPYLATLLRVGYRGQGHEEHNRSRLRSSQACTPLGVSLYRNTSVGSRDMIILRSQA